MKSIFDVLSHMSNFSELRETASLNICSWKAEHENVYTEFKNRMDNISTGDLSALKEKILLFTEENPESICLAYLLKALTMDDAVKKNISYATFHRAIEQLTGRKIGIDSPQKRYGELKDFGFYGPQKGSWARAKAIIYHWSDIFASVVFTQT